MRHHVFGRKLNRDIKSRRILFRNLISSLIEKERIETTEARAKAIRGLVDKLVFKAKERTSNSKRAIQTFLIKEDVVEKLVNKIAPGLGNRVGGFTRIIRLDNRRGDNAPMVQMEFVKEVQDKTEIVPEKKDKEKSKKERKRGNQINQSK